MVYNLNLNIKFVAGLCNSVKSLYESQCIKSKSSSDSGFDLALPCDVLIPKKSLGFKIPLGVMCEPNYSDNVKRGVYLFPRSSTGSKTPLRLSNGTGIIDNGYRGELIACVDNVSETDYKGVCGTRLFQLCSGDLSPMSVNVVEKLTNTERQCGGYGSTGA
tara:strand:+ start:16253 stop:16735 length:483 start_codon:yes stop_codon:yes gene_type:complete